MEDILDVYQRPYDPLRPVICLDETNRHLIEKRRIPAKPGSLQREDHEYRRCGVVDLFVAFEPLACKRVIKLTSTRTAVDFAHFLHELVDVHYSHCEKIVLVMDNLNIHSIASLYKAFEPVQARQIIQRLEITKKASRIPSSDGIGGSLTLPVQDPIDQLHIQSAPHGIGQPVILPLLVLLYIKGPQ